MNPPKMIKNQFAQGLPSRARVHSNNRTCKYFLTYSLANYSSLLQLSKIGTAKTVPALLLDPALRGSLYQEMACNIGIFILHAYIVVIYYL